MGTLLLYNPWVQIYLLYAVVLSVIFIWDCLHSAPVAVERIRTPPNEAAATPAPPRSQEPLDVEARALEAGKDVRTVRTLFSTKKRG